VSRTHKDAPRSGTVLEIERTDDGKFDLFVNRELVHARVSEASIPDWLCVRFGFCGEEYDAILCEVKKNGRAKVTF
jgi:hypothetical protein